MKITLDTYKHILDSLYDGVYITDSDRRIVYWNNGAKRITGYKSAEVVGKHCRDNILVHIDEKGNELCTAMCPVARTLGDGRSREARVYLHHKDGHRIPVNVRVSPLSDPHGHILGAVEVFTDNSIQTRVEERVRELEKMALIDPLTQVGNRRFVEANLLSRLDAMKRYEWQFGILFIDIDHFKLINDRFGHETGDKVLKMVADTLSLDLRKLDLLGRWGGEEFVAIVMNVDHYLLGSIAERMLVLVRNSFFTREQEKIRVTVSIGATLAKPGDTMETLIKRADDLMYRSKSGGRDRVSI